MSHKLSQPLIPGIHRPPVDDYETLPPAPSAPLSPYEHHQIPHAMMVEESVDGPPEVLSPLRASHEPSQVSNGTQTVSRLAPGGSLPLPIREFIYIPNPHLPPQTAPSAVGKSCRNCCKFLMSLICLILIVYFFYLYHPKYLPIVAVMLLACFLLWLRCC